MRSALAWRQLTEEDFRNGKSEEVSVDSRGETFSWFPRRGKDLTIARNADLVRRLLKRIVDLFSSEQNIFLGCNRIKLDLLAKLDCLFSPAVVVDSKGSIYAAAAPGDRVFAVKPHSDKYDTLFKTGGDTVTTLCVDDRDNIYAGVAADGKVWRYDAVKKTASVFLIPDKPI